MQGCTACKWTISRLPQTPMMSRETRWSVSKLHGSACRTPSRCTALLGARPPQGGSHWDWDLGFIGFPNCTVPPVGPLGARPPQVGWDSQSHNGVRFWGFQGSAAARQPPHVGKALLRTHRGLGSRLFCCPAGANSLALQVSYVTMAISEEESCVTG